jgi:23S rRNA C2498 (ribose-2'-O)-methylase RlmM
MKRIWPFVEETLATLADRIAPLEGRPTLRARQLYHDRNEITVCIIRKPSG